ncbi:uncharacterized protein LOC6603040 [Drosophila persimilis]|uniref:uncharacterized protein LOC6603040 n=1 Tax=Drosophila persimilis TaxID=7234 RepID=UPI000F08BB17|nr:uncharacterized protein LOC6603040 [Drosophila persimilis]
MTISNWYKWIDVDFNSTPRRLSKKPETIPRCDQLDGKIRAILLEQSANMLRFSRKQAGVDSQKRKPKKPKLGKLTPSVYEFQKIYENRRKDLCERWDRATRTENQFHSTPMPNFNRLHKRLEKMRSSLGSGQVLTKPRTPHTLVMSMQAELRRKREIKELKKKTKPKFVPKINRYPLPNLYRQPFIPRIESSTIQVKPFNLRSEERGKRRKQFDQQINRKMTERSQKEAMEWVKREEEEYLKQRLKTVFKATPNPWKRTKAITDAISHQ